MCRERGLKEGKVQRVKSCRFETTRSLLPQKKATSRSHESVRKALHTYPGQVSEVLLTAHFTFRMALVEFGSTGYFCIIFGHQIAERSHANSLEASFDLVQDQATTWTSGIGSVEV